jgi:hypothetical protein
LEKVESYQQRVRIVQHTFAGLSLGSILVLLALGLSIIFGLMLVISLAHGEFMMVGAYTTYVFTESVMTYQPSNMWDGFNVYAYPDAAAVPADEHHRRSMYSFVKRNAPHPNMATFDLPDRGGSTARRRTSNSPLEALVLLDDPQFLEAYRALAAKVLATETSADARLTTIVRLATRRHPRADEMATLRDYYAAQVKRFSGDHGAASALVKTGVTPVPAGVDVVQLAALTNVVTVVMNTPDAYTLR